MEDEPRAGSQATVFGLDVYSEVPLAFLGESPAKPTGRTLEISTQTGSAKGDWPADVELVCDERQPDGSVVFQIEAHPEAGYLIWGPDYGSYRLAADGRTLRCHPEAHADAVWQRLLIAQVLPFAALLRGLEVFHSSAVVRDGHAVAFLGPSRAGKTSLALQLCRRGARFLADDVVVLEQRAGELIAHPGTPIAGVDHAEARRTLAAAQPPAGPTVAVNDRERLVRLESFGEPAPLRALFLLERRGDGPEHPRFEPLADAQPLLAATFNSVLVTSERLRGLLDICALAAQLRVERIVVGPTAGASEVGAAVERRFGAWK